jgi:hypothetical protein
MDVSRRYRRRHQAGQTRTESAELREARKPIRLRQQGNEALRWGGYLS